MVIIDELFEQVLCWQRGLDYEIIALQAVTADLLKGDTIHHACGIPVQKKVPKLPLPKLLFLKILLINWYFSHKISKLICPEGQMPKPLFKS